MKGVIAASAGNHALALAYHGHQMDIPVVVVMPEVAPLMKVREGREGKREGGREGISEYLITLQVERCRHYGAEVIVTGRDMGESMKIAMEMAKERQMIYINGQVLLFLLPHLPQSPMSLILPSTLSLPYNNSFHP